MTDPMKIRAKLVGDITEIKVLISHPMENGQRKDNAGNTVPPHYIQNLTVEVGGKMVVSGQTGISISRNPVFGFKLKGAKAGDKVVIRWRDSRGETRADETTIVAG
jgi:sulfur-oxidizing protein SoxZ